MIKLEALRVFVTVAEIGNIRDAAERLGRTPSAVSMTLKQLEESVGASLFETDRKNALTALGRFTLETARAQILGYDKLVSTIHAFAQNRIGKLTLACVPSVAANVVPQVVSRFVADNPEVELELFDADSVGVAALVESGQADLGVAGRPDAPGVVGFTPLFSCPFTVLCAADSPLAGLGRPISWDDLESVTLIRNGAAETIEVPAYRRLVGRATLTVRNTTSLIAMTSGNLGVTLLPALSAVSLPPQVKACPLEDDSVLWTVGVLERKGITRSPVAKAFLDLLRLESPRLIEEPPWEDK